MILLISIVEDLNIVALIRLITAYKSIVIHLLYDAACWGFFFVAVLKIGTKREKVFFL